MLCYRAHTRQADDGGVEAVVFPGIGIKNYRSLGDEMVFLAGLQRITTFIGPNNVGKSNCLSIFSDHLSSIHKAIMTSSRVASFNRPRDIFFVSEEPAARRLFSVRWPVDPRILDGTLLHPLMEVDRLTHGTDHLWLEFEENDETAYELRLSKDFIDELSASGAPWGELSRNLTKTTGGAPGDDIRRVLEWIRSTWMITPPETLVIPAFRRMASGGGEDGRFDGSGLFEKLDKLGRPDFFEHDARQQHKLLLSFLRQVLDDPQADYSLTDQNQHLVLHLNGQHMRLDMLGTGIEHMMLCVIAAVVRPGALMAIEEPEIHLHPRFQRTLMSFFREHTEAQILIATHSAHLIDQSEGAIRATMTDHRTRVEAVADGALLGLLDELGYRASDILQANCVIWVEGPSDRIYLRAWMGETKPDLVEGVHFSIMFYGGALLAHLQAGADEQPADDRVRLSRLNQHFALVADSDRDSDRGTLKPRLEQFIEELNGAHYLHKWVTSGREIENYIPAQEWERAVKEVHPSVAEVIVAGKFDSPFQFTKADGEVFSGFNKVAIARNVVGNNPSIPDVFDLRQEVDNLCEFVMAANR